MSIASGRERVAALLRAAARLRDPDDALGQEARRNLPAATGLSAENVDRALRHHLESEAKESLFSYALPDDARAARAHLVLSANVFVGVLRALCLAALRGDTVIVLPSRREPLSVALLRRAGSNLSFVQIASTLETSARDEVHVYGRDETIATIAATLPAGAWLWGHGAGLGLVAARDGRNIDVEALADDVVVFDQRGCLSPRVVVVREGGEALGERLAHALAARRRSLPLGAISDEERAAAARYVATQNAVGQIYGELGALVGVVIEPRALLAPAVPRLVHVIETTVPAALLVPLEPAITCVAGDDEAVTALFPRSRRSVVGQMQRPPLDGPVDLRVPRPVPIEATSRMTK
jgi:hypothetical protein